MQGPLEVTLMPCRNWGESEEEEEEGAEGGRVALAPGKMHQRSICRKDQLGD